MTLINQGILRKGDSLYMNDGVYGSFDELTLPGWTAGICAQDAYTLDAQEPRARDGRSGKSVSHLWPDL